MGQRHPDLVNHWRDFRDELSNRFFGKCGYCERRCDGTATVPTVDHFRPRSRFPELTYEWTNWVFSCARCNEEKANRWPDSGFVDPCAVPLDERPESYLDFDDRTGEVIAQAGLTQAARVKAQNTIDDIGLNALDLRIRRLDTLEDFKERVAENDALDILSTSERQAIRQAIMDRVVAPDREFAGVMGMALTWTPADGRIVAVVRLKPSPPS